MTYCDRPNNYQSGTIFSTLQFTLKIFEEIYGIPNLFVASSHMQPFENEAHSIYIIMTNCLCIMQADYPITTMEFIRLKLAIIYVHK